jgi:SAM-dependent methyltransferase
MNPLVKYSFKYVEECNMCGSDAKNHIVMGRRLNGSQGRKPKSKIGITTTVMKCRECGLVYANPIPIPIDIQSHYGIPPDGYWNQQYFEPGNSDFQEEIRKLRSMMEIKPGYKSLDIGAGIGKNMKTLEEAGFDSYGLEPSMSFYSEVLKTTEIKADNIKCSTIEDAEYPSEHFHFISFSAVLEHLYDPSAAIEKALGWLKPNGIIFIEVPSAKWLIGRLINMYYRLIGTDYVTNISPMHIPFHLYEFELKSFQKNLKNKCEISDYEYFACPTHLPFKALDSVLTSYMEKTKTGMQLMLWLRKTTHLNN